ncbi:ABC transporter permease [Candidatus Saccharibacteria bacterium]|nr:ABC transporter permease [Candidatus Saccharibacteria bacterium]
MWSGNLKAAMSSLRQRRWRTTFTMLGIIIGISSVVTVVSLGDGLKHQIVGQINQLGSNVLTVRPGKVINKQNGLSSLNLYSFLAPSTLTSRDVESIQNLGSVESVAPIGFVTNVASGDNGELDDVFVAGTGGSLFELLNQKIVYGAPFTDELDSNSAIIGSAIAMKMFGVLNPVGSTVHIDGQDFIVHGVLAPSQGGLLSVAQTDYNNSIFIPLTAANTLTSGHTNILQMLIQVQPQVKLDKASAQIHKAIANNHNGTADFSILKQDELLGVTDQVLNKVTNFISAIAAISLLVGGIGIMNIMLVSVSERTREIGIRKAIGATNRQILNQFLVEGLVLSIGGGLIGIGLSYLISLLLRLYTSWHPVITIPTLALAAGVSVGVGVIFSIAPALQAARKNPIDALRGE